MSLLFFQVEWPLSDQIIKLEVKVARQGMDQYVIKADLREGDRNILHFQGPITAAIAQNVVKFDTNVAITLLNYDPFSVVLAFEFSDHVEKLQFAIKKGSVDIVRLEWGLITHLGNNYTTMVFDVILPRLLSARVDIMASQRFYSYTISADMFSDIPSLSRGIIAHLSTDLEHGGVKLDLVWNAETYPEKKLHIEGHYKMVALVPSSFLLR